MRFILSICKVHPPCCGQTIRLNNHSNDLDISHFENKKINLISGRFFKKKNSDYKLVINKLKRNKLIKIMCHFFHAKAF